MNPRRAIAELITRGDIAQLGGGHVLVSELSTELLEYLSAFDADLEDLEDDEHDEDGQVAEANEQRV